MHRKAEQRKPTKSPYAIPKQNNLCFTVAFAPASIACLACSKISGKHFVYISEDQTSFLYGESLIPKANNISWAFCLPCYITLIKRI